MHDTPSGQNHFYVLHNHGRLMHDGQMICDTPQYRGGEVTPPNAGLGLSAVNGFVNRAIQRTIHQQLQSWIRKSSPSSSLRSESVSPLFSRRISKKVY